MAMKVAMEIKKQADTNCFTPFHNRVQIPLTPPSENTAQVTLGGVSFTFLFRLDFSCILPLPCLIYQRILEMIFAAEGRHTFSLHNSAILLPDHIVCV